MNLRTLLISVVLLGLVLLGTLTLLSPGIFLETDPTAHDQPQFIVGDLSVPKTSFLRLYNEVSYGVFFIALAIVSLYLLRRLIASTTGPLILIDKATIRSGAELIRTHPLGTVILVVYTALMYYDTNYFYIELVGWYAKVFTPDLLNNFRLNDRFIAETMWRNDYRFFPLAHQDLHVLSWFTPYVKVWILFNALELLAILVVTTRFVRAFSNTGAPYLFLGASLLFLFNPAAVEPFFQFIYAERMLVLLFALFVYSYLRYQQTREDRYFYATLLSALFGIFFKDTAFVLFGVPPIVTLLSGLLGKYAGYRPYSSTHQLATLTNEYRLELILIGLLLVYVVLYIFLSGLPSLSFGAGAYTSDTGGCTITGILDDVAVTTVFVMLFIRMFLIAIGKQSVALLDGLNAAAVVYLVALACLVGYKSSSYLSLPIQFVGVLDLLYLWTIVYRVLPARPAAARVAPVAAILVALILAYEQATPPNFFTKVSTVKQVERSWLATYRKARKLVQEKIARGEEVNIIYTRSWFNDARHLNRLHYDRLIFLDPTDHSYTVMAGTGQGSLYRPKSGDLLLLIDKRGVPVLGHAIQDYKLVFDYDKNSDNAKIYEYK